MPARKPVTCRDTPVGRSWVGRCRCAGSLAVTARLDADSFVHAAFVFTKTIPAGVSLPHAKATITMTTVWNNA
jgi:hypothetical protein